MGGRGGASSSGGTAQERKLVDSMDNPTDSGQRYTAAKQLVNNAKLHESSIIQRQEMAEPEHMASIPVKGKPMYFSPADYAAAEKAQALEDSMDQMPDLQKPIELSNTVTKQKNKKDPALKTSVSDDGKDITYHDDVKPTKEHVAPAEAKAATNQIKASGNPEPMASYAVVFAGDEPSPDTTPPVTVESDFEASLALYLLDKTSFQASFPERYAFINVWIKTIV